jgi:hypothetical protein
LDGSLSVGLRRGLDHLLGGKRPDMHGIA